MTDRSIEARDQRLRQEKENAKGKEQRELEQDQEIGAAGVESSAANGGTVVSGIREVGSNSAVDGDDVAISEGLANADFTQTDQFPFQDANKEWKHFYAVISELVKDMR